MRRKVFEDLNDDVFGHLIRRGILTMRKRVRVPVTLSVRAIQKLTLRCLATHTNLMSERGLQP